MLTIELDHIGKKFKNEWIFRDLNFTFVDNTQYAIIGHNGSGKSTLLHIISGASQPSTGKLNYILDGQHVSEDLLYKEISFAAPYVELIEELTLKEAVEFHLKFKSLIEGVSIEDFYEISQLQAHVSKPISQFSSGMKQRLKLSLAFLTNSKVLLLDEPTTNLDESGVSWFFVNLSKYTANKLTIISSNDKMEIKSCTEFIDITNFKN